MLSSGVWLSTSGYFGRTLRVELSVHQPQISPPPVEFQALIPVDVQLRDRSIGRRGPEQTIPWQSEERSSSSTIACLCLCLNVPLLSWRTVSRPARSPAQVSSRVSGRQSRNANRPNRRDDLPFPGNASSLVHRWRHDLQLFPRRQRDDGCVPTMASTTSSLMALALMWM